MSKPLSKYARKQIVKLGREAFTSQDAALPINPYHNRDTAREQAWSEGFATAARAWYDKPRDDL